MVQGCALARTLRCSCYSWPRCPPAEGLLLATVHCPSCAFAGDEDAELGCRTDWRWLWPGTALELPLPEDLGWLLLLLLPPLCH